MGSGNGVGMLKHCLSRQASLSPDLSITVDANIGHWAACG
jgi:hypothetical protein